MKKAMTWLAPAVLGVMGLGCSRGYQAAPPNKEVHLTVLVYPAPNVPGGCASVTIPQYAYVRQNDDVIWDIKNDTCAAAGEVVIQIDPNVVDIPGQPKGKDESGKEVRKASERKGKVKGSTGTYPYHTKLLGTGFEEDPRIEIW